MYNRYIPQPDGSFRRNRMPEGHRPAAPQPPPVPECVNPPEPPPVPVHPPRHLQNRRKTPVKKDDRVSGFLRRLLPKDFDTGDLIVVLLLLLMAGDCQEDQNTALLTLALYFFM